MTPTTLLTRFLACSVVSIFASNMPAPAAIRTATYDTEAEAGAAEQLESMGDTEVTDGMESTVAPDGYHEEGMDPGDIGGITPITDEEEVTPIPGDGGIQDPPTPCTQFNAAKGAAARVYGASTGNPDVVVDAMFAPEGTAWNNLTYAVTLANTGYLEVDLLGEFLVEKLMFQADCNDTYRVDSSTDGKTWTDLSTYGTASCPGLRTRNSVQLPAGVSARYLKVSRVSGDGMNSVSELQAFATECRGW